MSKVTLSDITSGYAGNTTYNNNNDVIEAAFDNTLSRDGTGPNQMLGTLDMNGQRLINLPLPVSGAEPVRLQDVGLFSSGVKGDPGGNVLAVGHFSALGGVTVPAGTERIITDGYASTGVGAAQYKHTATTGATLFRKQDLGGRWWELDEPRPTVYQFGALNDNSTDDTNAWKGARDYSILYGVAIHAPGGVLGASRYILSSEIRLDSGSAGLNGAAFYGDGMDYTVIAHKLATTTTNLFSFYGGSGNTTNKFIRGMTIQPFSGFTGNGRIIYIDGQCFAKVTDVEIYNSAVGFSINNIAGGSFSEYNQFLGFRLIGNTTGIAFTVNGGGNSFRGNRLQGLINVGTTGISVTGTSQATFLYENMWDINYQGAVGNPNIISLTNSVCKYNYGSIRGEAAGNFASDASSQWAFNGDLVSQGAITFSGTLGVYGFNMISSIGIQQSSGAAMTDTHLTAYKAGGLGDLNSLTDKSNTQAPAAFGLIGGSLGSVALGSYNGANSDGVYLGQLPFGSTTKTFVARTFFRHDGAVVEFYGGGQTDIRQGGQTGQLLLAANGRVGGNLGQDTIVPVTGNGGTPQSITVAVNANNRSMSMGMLIIYGANFEDAYIVGWKFPVPGGINNVFYSRIEHFNSTAGAVADTNGATDFTVDSTGHLKVSITTTQAMTIRYQGLSTGITLTS